MPQVLATTEGSGHMLGIVVAAGTSLPAISAGLVIMLILGGLLAAMSHTAKASTRLLSTATTAGFFNIVLSFSEDVLVVILVLLSLLVPIVMLILVGLFVIAFGPLVLRVWRWRLRRNEGL
jgi:hypothetical protein